LVFHSVKTVGNGITQCSHAEFRGPSASNATASTNPKITANLVGAARPMPKSILQG